MNDRRRATGDGRRATGDGRRATGDGRRAVVLFAARSANALHRLLDVIPVFAGDDRVSRLFTLVPGSDFGLEALAAIERAEARTLPWAQARQRSFDLILAASPKGDLHLHGPCVLLPHGAGFNKTVPGEGAMPSGLDPANVMPGGHALASFYALAHPSQLARLAEFSPRAAERAAVVGDPVLDRILASRSHRDRYRETLGTGGRKLIVLTSTWGPESLLERRPGLVAELATRLPHDAYQLAALAHPNVRGQIGGFELSERLAPALDAGLILAEPYQEWAALLIAADAVITDHGSAALYAGALDRPVIAACDGGTELLPGSPMAALLAAVPSLDQPGDLRDHLPDDLPGALEAAISAYRPGSGPTVAESAFAEQGRAIELLRAEVYRLLGLAPPDVIAAARPLPIPVTAARPVSAFAVKTYTDGDEVRVERFPAHTDVPAHHLAAEYGAASERHLRGAGLVYRRASRDDRAAQVGLTPSAPHSETWTADGWTARVLDDYPGCRTAAVILSPELGVARTRAGSFLTVRIEPRQAGGRIVHTDPAAVLSAVHEWLARDPALTAVI
ncbi:MAG: hypothetical protein J2P26_01445, partial [Nocardiopsaceae bacterium]|nr:hypothetical protein [Nocardiopsaceae bacterium]